MTAPIYNARLAANVHPGFRARPLESGSISELAGLSLAPEGTIVAQLEMGTGERGVVRSIAWFARPVGTPDVSLAFGVGMGFRLTVNEVPLRSFGLVPYNISRPPFTFLPTPATGVALAPDVGGGGSSSLWMGGLDLSPLELLLAPEDVFDVRYVKPAITAANVQIVARAVGWYWPITFEEDGEGALYPPI